MVIRKSTKKIKKKGKPRKTSTKGGMGLLDTIIDKLPFELHLKGYNFLGPGTKLEKRLARGDNGINKLDEFCKEHDIAYATHKDSAERYKADKKLGSEALKRVFSKDAKLGERAASLLVSAAMKAKTGLTKVGLGVSKLNCKKKKKSKKSSKEIAFATLIKDAKAGIKKSKVKSVESMVNAALRSAKKTAQSGRVKPPRILKVPSYTGGVLPIVPILAGLSAIGAIVGSASNVVRTAKDINVKQQQLEEFKRHNKAIEMKVGKGLYLRPHAKGSGLYLNPSPKNG